MSAGALQTQTKSLTPEVITVGRKNFFLTHRILELTRLMRKNHPAESHHRFLLKNKQKKNTSSTSTRNLLSNVIN